MDMPEISNQLKPKQIERFKTKLGKQAGRMMEQHIAFSVSFYRPEMYKMHVSTILKGSNNFPIERSVEEIVRSSLSKSNHRADGTAFCLAFQFIFRNTAQNLQILRKRMKMNLNDMTEMTRARLLVKSQKL